VRGKRIFGVSWDKLIRAVSLRSLLTWVAVERVDPRADPPASGSERSRGGYARPVSSHAPPPADENGKKTAWVVAWSALVMGVVMMLLLCVVLPV
jgi:hypothetical protein